MDARATIGHMGALLSHKEFSQGEKPSPQAKSGLRKTDMKHHGSFGEGPATKGGHGLSAKKECPIMFQGGDQIEATP